MKNRRPAFLVVFAAAACTFLGAENIKPFVMPSARAAGFGGIHAAQGDDFSSLFSNPASFAGIERQFSAAEISISLYGPVFEMLDLAVHSSGPVDITSLIASGDFAAGFDMGGPVALGWVGGGLGFGIFNRTYADAVVDPSLLLLRPAVSEEVLLLGGYSFPVFKKRDHRLDVGFLGKAYYRGTLNLESSITDIADMFSGVSSRPFETHFGVGLDLGIKYTFAGKLSFAAAGYDVFSPALVTRYASFSDYGGGGSQDYATVTPRLALGALYKIQNDFLDRYVSDFIVMLDYRDILDPFTASSPRNPLLNIGFGLEVKLLRVLSVRAGAADALPSFGFGIDMKILQFDFAVRGKEMGSDPGKQSVYAVDLGLLFRY
ncbi:MAG: hypothetical protein LBI67_06915 [Treponema sp.]|jgi:hypothetical protein|nr:hypothetical protein [Treponema sp.]